MTEPEILAAIASGQRRFTGSGPGFEAIAERIQSLVLAGKLSGFREDVKYVKGRQVVVAVEVLMLFKPPGLEKDSRSASYAR